MVSRKIELLNKEIYQKTHEIQKEKIDKAIERAVKKLEAQIPRFTHCFAGATRKDNKYIYGETDNSGWVCGMQTGEFLLAYELCGKEAFKDIVLQHVDSYADRNERKYDMQFHDVGFVFTPSCVAAYKVLGNEKAYKTALSAAEYFYDTSYCKKGKFIMRFPEGISGDEASCRTMMDTLMNAPLLFWAGNETGRKEFTEAASWQYKTTEKCLIREDGSSYHHYQFDTETFEPVRGLTYQGISDESTWSRGHAWGIYGLAIAYSYTGDEHLLELHRDITCYFLNQLPADSIPHADFDLKEATDFRDSSAAAIAVCGLLEMVKHLPDSAPQKKVYKNAASILLEALIDQCTEDIGQEYDGLLYKVSAGASRNKDYPGEGCGIYGDYHYLEALMRYRNPNWTMYW